MTNNEDIPAEIRLFILAKIDSVPHLEALLLIWGHGSKTWTDDDLAKSLFVSAASAKKIANDLVRRGWIKRVSTKQDEFAYGAAHTIVCFLLSLWSLRLKVFLGFSVYSHHHRVIAYRWLIWRD